jgi:putative transposase
MPRRKFPVGTQLPVFTSVRCSNRDWFPIPIENVWAIFTRYLWFVHHAYRLEIYSYILMQNHFHILCRAPSGDFGSPMNYLVREISKAIAKEAGVINHIFGNRQHPCVLNKNSNFENAYKYLYRNSVHAGIVRNVEDYQFSSLRGLLGLDRSEVPLVEDTLLIPDMERCLTWLNTEYKPADHENMRKALRRSEFRAPRSKGAKASDLNTEVI